MDRKDPTTDLQEDQTTPEPADDTEGHVQPDRMVRKQAASDGDDDVAGHKQAQ